MQSCDLRFSYILVPRPNSYSIFVVIQYSGSMSITATLNTLNAAVVEAFQSDTSIYGGSTVIKARVPSGATVGNAIRFTEGTNNLMRVSDCWRRPLVGAGVVMRFGPCRSPLQASQLSATLLVSAGCCSLALGGHSLCCRVASLLEVAA